MATRLYFTANDATPIAEPTPDASWQSTTGFVRRNLSTAKAAATETRAAVAVTSGAGNETLGFQLISEPLNAGAVSGTVSLVSRGNELAGNDNIAAKVQIIRVVSRDGTTVRGTLLAFGNGANTTELGTTPAGRTHADATSLSSVTAQQGDRIVVEIGYGMLTTGTSPAYDMVIGGDGTDHANTEGDVTGTVPWVEFSQTLSFEVAGVTGTLAVTQAGDTLAAAGTSTPPPVTVLTQGSNATDATSFVTASVDPADDAVVWLHVALRHASLEPSTPSISGCGLTWTLVPEQNAADYYFDTATTRTKHFLFRGHHATPTAGAVTIDCGGVTHAGAVWEVLQHTDVNNPSNPLVQAASARNAGGNTIGTSGTATFPAGVGAANTVLMFLANFDNAAGAVTPEAGYSQVAFEGPLAGESNLSVGSYVDLVGADATPSVSWNTSALWGLIAVEVAPLDVNVTGTLAASQGGDTLAAAGILRYTGTLAQTQAAQTLAATGVLRYTGTLNVTAGGDTLAASGTVAGVATYVRVSQVYLQAPAGAEGATGALSVTQAPQTLTAAGVLRYTGTLAVTQAPQTLSASGGTAQNIGALAVTQANQTLAAAGILRYTGTLAVTQADQTLAAAGVLRYTGSLAQTQAAQTLAASGTVTSLGIAGSLSVTQADQTLAATGVLRYTGTLSQTQAPQTLTASGWIRVTGTLTVTQAAQTLSATGGTAQHIGTLAVTQANQTLAAAGVLQYTGTLVVSQAAQTLSAAGTAAPPTVTGTLTITQAANTLAAAGTVTIIGTAGNLAVTQANQTLAALGVLPGYIAFGVNTRGRSSSPDGRGSTTPGKDARGRTLVGINAR